MTILARAADARVPDRTGLAPCPERDSIVDATRCVTGDTRGLRRLYHDFRYDGVR